MPDTPTASSSGPLRGGIAVPGDKSLSHRALILAAMTEGESRMAGLSDGLDVRRTAAAVEALGAEVVREGAEWRVRGGAWRSPDVPLDCGNSGTTARLLMGAVAGRPITATFIGDASLSRRPMSRVSDPLRRMGARVSADALPLTVTGEAFGPIRHLNAVASAQVKSAVLLAGLGSDASVAVVEPCRSRDHTERMLAAFGVDVATHAAEHGCVVALPPRRRLTPATLAIAGDPSSAAFPLAAALLVPGSEVTARGLLANPLRTGLFDTLREMGADLLATNARVVGGEPVADVTSRASRLRGVEVPAERAPSMIDEYPILAVTAAFAEGETVMHGLAELRVKESDRLAAIVAGLTACGVAARVEGDSLIVAGCAVSGGAQVATGGDHRIAMAFLVLGLASRAPVRVDEAAMIDTSFPGFAALMRGLGAAIA